MGNCTSAETEPLEHSTPNNARVHNPNVTNLTQTKIQVQEDTNIRNTETSRVESMHISPRPRTGSPKPHSSSSSSIPPEIPPSITQVTVTDITKLPVYIPPGSPVQLESSRFTHSGNEQSTLILIGPKLESVSEFLVLLFLFSKVHFLSLLVSR